MARNLRLVPWLITLGIAGLTALAYRQGLRGGFLFDDFANLPALGETGPITHWDTFWRYITSGTADPTGRPLALLSFLLDAHNWPASPHPFKRTNLLIHLLNGTLLFILLQRLGKTPTTGGKRTSLRADLAAATGATLWLAHPLFVSTTLYIVQREAMLPATFTLLGLLAWLHGRRVMTAGAMAKGLAWISGGLGLCTGLAFLSKANGMLLPALAIVLELALLRPCESGLKRISPPRSYTRAMVLLGGVPTLVITLYLLYVGWQGITTGVSDARPWTLGQRLITEPRILLTYLHMLWLPTPFTAGLFNDQIKASASLLHPWTTLPSIIIVVSLIVGAWRARHQWPVLATAILFFFVGQSIESSTIALELFFEHRNYVPSLLMFWPLALWLFDASPARSRPDIDGATGARHNMQALANDSPSRSPWRYPKYLLAVAAVGGLLFMTWSRADLWGNTHDQALLWAQLNPSSPRAQAFAAQAEVASGHPELAIRRLQPALAAAPTEVQLALNLVAARCTAGNLDRATLESAEHALATARDSGSLLSSWFGRAIDQAGAARCAPLDLAEIERLLLAAQGNPRLTSNPGRQQDIFYLLGRIAILRGRPDQALALFNAGLKEQPRPSLVLSQAATLGSAGFPAQGLAHLDFFESLPPASSAAGWNMARLHAYVLARQQYWPKEMARLRATLQQDLLDSQATPR